jgi:hypothetical protein
MTTAYVIERGIPIPRGRGGLTPSHQGPRTAWTQTLDALEVGESVKTAEAREYNAAVQFAAKVKPKRFAFRKVDREGWRIWRTE